MGAANMSAEGRAKLWAREKLEQLTPKPRPERQPHHRIKVMREILCAPRPDRDWTDEIHPDDRAFHHQSERELFFDADAEHAARRRHQDSSGETPETHAVALGDDSDEDGLT